MEKVLTSQQLQDYKRRFLPGLAFEMYEEQKRDFVNSINASQTQERRCEQIERSFKHAAFVEMQEAGKKCLGVLDRGQLTVLHREVDGENHAAQVTSKHRDWPA